MSLLDGQTDMSNVSMCICQHVMCMCCFAFSFYQHVTCSLGHLRNTEKSEMKHIVLQVINYDITPDQPK